MVKLLQAEVCTAMLADRLSQNATANSAAQQQISSSLGLPPTNISTNTQIPAGFALNDNGGSANFGTKNTNYPQDGSGNRYNSECGQVTWNVSTNITLKSQQTVGGINLNPFINVGGHQETVTSNVSSAASQDTAQTLMNAAMTQIILDISPLANQIARANLTAQSDPATLSTVNNEVGPAAGGAIIDYTSLIAPLRQAANNSANSSIYTTLKNTKSQGWVVAGAFYPLMGKLQQGQQATLASLLPNTPTLGQLAQGQAQQGTANLSGLTSADKTAIASTVSYIGGYTPLVNDYVTNYSPASLNSALGVGTGGGGTNYNNSPGSFAGLLDKSGMQKAAAVVGASAIAAGPVGWVTIPLMLGMAVDMAQHFKDAIQPSGDLTNQDPILTLQAYGFWLMDQALIFLVTAYSLVYVLALALSFVPSVNMVGSTQVSSAMETPLITMFFAAVMVAGFTFAVYIPLIIFVVWFSAVLGFFGQTFLAMVSGPWLRYV